MKRRSGILMPIASLPGRYGIGGLTKEAYRFVDFLAAAGQSYWQILPLGQTGYGDSPYQSFSTFAGNPYFIDVDALIQAGYLTQEQADALDGTGTGAKESPEASGAFIDYEKVYRTRFRLLHEAYENSPYALHAAAPWTDKAYDDTRADFARFIEEEASWLDDYALYSAVKKEMNGRPYIDWDDDIRLRQPAAMAYWKEKLADEIRFWQFQQFLFAGQWRALKAYANEKGIGIIGDIPIYVAFDSADTWSHPELFELDEKGFPTVVSGCPPDAFSATGQLWGNPIYRWDYHRKTGYAWWIRRLAWCFRLYDVVRIDHFRGFDEYYAIPYGDPTAEFGKWMPGPGYDLFAVMKRELGHRDVIAEDLGFMTDSVRKLVRKSGFPSMKVLQFAFDSREDSDYLPHNYTNNCVVYTGTHDNETARGWYDHVCRHDRVFAKKYCQIRSEAGAAWGLIRTAMASVADTCIIPMQDYLNLGDEARINTPSTLGGNWIWRMAEGADDAALAARIRDLTRLYGRLPKQAK